MVAVATTALAAAPKPGARFHGQGGDYWNNGPTWHRAATAGFSFRTNSDGTQILGFKGHASYYCGGGAATIADTGINVGGRGRFSDRFSLPNKEPNGKTNGRVYVAISGAFLKGGKRASVSYLVDYVFKGKHVSNPYSTSNPRALGCASWVRGIASTG
jgi:hypothetical protein